MGLTVGEGIGEFVGRYDGMGVLLVWPAAVAQSARSVATLFRRIIFAIGPAPTRDVCPAVGSATTCSERSRRAARILPGALWGACFVCLSLYRVACWPRLGAQPGCLL